MQVTLDLSVACTYVWFPKSAEFGLKGLSPNHSQGKSPSCLGPDQVQGLGLPATPHNIIHSALSERE